MSARFDRRAPAPYARDMTPRFFIDAALSAGERVALPADVEHHARRVLRLHAGDAVVLFNGRGGEYAGTLQEGAVDIARHDAVERESPIAVTLLQAWIATDKLDWVVEKAVELGVARLVLSPAARSVVRLDGARRTARLTKLVQLARAACAQCGRNRVPSLDAADTLKDALRLARGAGPAWLLDPTATEPLAPRGAHADGAIAVGPEGGFTADEMALARAAGWHPVALGPRILRTETAGLAALAALQAHAGDLK
jgi:16S rRNA (uracil1498-N3)-methyltransferase